MSKIPIIISTSDLYHHVLPIFFRLYDKHWGDPFTLVGYKKPEGLPDNCTFVSLGIQRGPAFFSDDLREYFKDQPNFFTWLMEDSFIWSFDRDGYNKLVQTITQPLNAVSIGRINLTTEGMKRDHHVHNDLYFCHRKTQYRLSTQPSIWNRNFLLQYMKSGLSPWQFETQYTNDRYLIIGPTKNVVDHNEGVRKHDIHKLNLEGIEL